MKELVVVVHGVGVKEAGVSADRLSANFRSGNYRPISSDDFVLTEQDPADAEASVMPKVFPCRVRRFDKTPTASKTTTANELILADFYWGDISRIGTGLVGIVYAFVTLVLGLAHPLRENAKTVFESGSFRHKAVFAFIHLIHGPIVAMNLALLGGMAIAWAVGLIGEGWDTGNVTVCLFTLVSLLAAWFLIKPHGKAFLSRLLGFWIGGIGVLVLIFLLFDFAVNAGKVSDFFLPIDNRLSDTFCNVSHIAPDAGAVAQTANNGNGSEICAKDLDTGIYKYGARVLALGLFFWLVTLAFALVPLATSFWNALLGKVKPNSMIVETMSVMILLWLLITGACWGVLAKSNILKQPLWVENGLFALPLYFFILVMLLLLAVFVAVRKRAGIKGAEALMSAHSSDIDARTNAAIQWLLGPSGENQRMIVNKKVLNLLKFCLVFSVLFLLFLILAPKFGTPGSVYVEGANDITAFFKSNVFVATFVLATIGGMITGFFSKYTAGGLAILKDVITYINNYSSFSIMNGQETDDGSGYVLRRQLHKRLKSLVEYFIELEDPDIITFVSHSQGTMIAIDTINKYGRSWHENGLDGKVMETRRRRLRLATMGSPYTHIYQNYFSESFMPVNQRPEIQHVDKGGVLYQWINIFRLDDFVGTFIDPKNQWPKEYCVGPRGHTDYWIDKEVGKILKDNI